VTTGQQLIELGRQQGIELGLREGMQRVLLRWLKQRFDNDVDAHVEQRIATASIKEIETWVGRILSAATLADLFAG
jgi:hypothetical protein